MGMLDAAERSIGKGLPLAKDAPSRKVLQDLLSQVRAARGRVAAERATNAAEVEAAREAAAKAELSFAHLLSADVLFLVAEAAVESDPGIGLRMGAVCRAWRDTMLASSSAWSHLVLGRRRPLAKTRLWAERSRGRIKRLTISTPPGVEHADIARALQPHVGNVEHLKFRYGNVPTAYFVEWHQLLRVKTLRVVGRRVGCLATDLDILAPEANVTVIDYTGPDGNLPPLQSMLLHSMFRRPGNAEQLASLHTLRANVGSMLDPRWLKTLSEIAPQMREVTMGCNTVANHGELHDPFSFEHLERLDIPDRAGTLLLLRYMSVPALTHFSCYGWEGSGMIRHLREPGLPRSKLVYLDIGNNAMLQDDLIDLLPELPSLRFLNVSFCSLDNGFMEALEAGEDTLLPNLEALSIAGHDDISAGPLRRMVLSRMPGSKPRKNKPAPVKVSAFAPTRRRAAVAPVEPEPSPESRNVAQLRWLNVDMCNNPNMDPAVLASLRKRLRFLSNHNSKNMERIQGRGMFAWDAVDDDLAETGTKRRGPCTRDALTAADDGDDGRAKKHQA